MKEIIDHFPNDPNEIDGINKNHSVVYLGKVDFFWQFRIPLDFIITIKSLQLHYVYR